MTNEKSIFRKKFFKPSQTEQYLYSVGWSEADEAFVARIAEFPSIAAHGETQEKALGEIRNVVVFVLNDLEQSSEPIPEPCRQTFF